MAKNSAPKVPVAPPKRKRDKEASKQKLFQAALEVFAKQGYDAATTKEIAKQAGVSEGLIHRYYDSKAGLLLAILSHMKDDESQPCKIPERKFDSLADLISEYLRQDFEHCAHDADFMRVAVSRSIVDPAISKLMTKHVFEGELPEFAQRLKEYQASGQIDKKEDMQALALIVTSLGFSLGFLGQVVFGVPPKRLKESADLFARILARGVAPTKSKTPR